MLLSIMPSKGDGNVVIKYYSQEQNLAEKLMQSSFSIYSKSKYNSMMHVGIRIE